MLNSSQSNVKMFGIACPQCSKASNETANRLVRDSCGHYKCRVCLLLDEEKCQQCKTSIEDTKPTVIKFENHTGVITCNGSAKKPEIYPIITNGIEKKEDIVNLKKDKHNKVRKSLKNNIVKRGYHSIVIPKHITVLKDPLRYNCGICNKEFSTKAHIKYHLYCTGQNKPFQCKLCSKEFITRSHLEAHVLKHSGNKPFLCNVCQKSFSERSKLNRHSIVHTGAKPYVCAECGKAFHSKESLKIHTLIHRGEKPYGCRICNLKFNNTSNLNKHLISHSNEKSHMCDQCGKTFKQKWALTVHRKSHLRLRPFECTTCSKAFVNNKDLQRHQLIHLETKAFNCSLCMTSFRRKDNLHRHVKNTHPGKKAEPVATTVKQLLVKPSKPVDNPNAIHVITASPACKNINKSETLVNKQHSRTGTVINGPLKLAFKTSAFKNCYNIHRDYDYDLAESVNICQKILSPHSPPARNIIRKVSEPTSTEICQKILSPFPSKPIHYETSFEHKKHAIIKNIKFKLPPNYTNLNLRTNDALKDVLPLKPVANVVLDAELVNNNNTYSELKTGATSVIVNSSQDSNMHWRRRTSQNLSTIKGLEN